MELKAQANIGYKDMLNDIQAVFAKYGPTLEQTADLVWRLMVSIVEHMPSESREKFREVCHKTIDHLFNNVDKSDSLT